MVKQFIHSLKGIAFAWYIEITKETIDGWDQLEHDFLTYFYSTHQTVNLLELAGIKQRKVKLMLEYIKRLRNLFLSYKEKVSGTSYIDIYFQGMH